MVLDQVSSYKYMGILVDTKLNFGLEVDYAVSVYCGQTVTHLSYC